MGTKRVMLQAPWRNRTTWLPNLEATRKPQHQGQIMSLQRKCRVCGYGFASEFLSSNDCTSLLRRGLSLGELRAAVKAYGAVQQMGQGGKCGLLSRSKSIYIGDGGVFGMISLLREGVKLVNCRNWSFQYLSRRYAAHTRWDLAHQFLSVITLYKSFIWWPAKWGFTLSFPRFELALATVSFLCRNIIIHSKFSISVFIGELPEVILKYRPFDSGDNGSCLAETYRSHV